MDTLGLLGGVGKGIGIANTIYSSIKTANYREKASETRGKILADIATIEGDIKDLSDQINNLTSKVDKIAARQAYNTLWGTGDVDNPFNVIKIKWSEYENDSIGVQTKNSLVTLRGHINDAMTSIKVKITDSSKAALETYYNMIVHEHSCISAVEKCYDYLNRYLTGRLLKGFSLYCHYTKLLSDLGTEDDGTANTWKTDISTILKEASSIAQTFINTIKEDGESTWVKNQKPTGKTFMCKTMYLGSNDLSNNGKQVIVGFEVSSNEADHLCLKIWRGDLRDDGYVENIIKEVKDTDGLVDFYTDGKCVPMGDNDSNTRDGLVTFFDMHEISAEFGQVAIDMKFEHSTQGWDKSNGNRIGAYVNMAIKWATIDKGKVDIQNAKWHSHSQWDSLHFTAKKNTYEERHYAGAGTWTTTEVYYSYTYESPWGIIYIADDLHFNTGTNNYESGVLCTPMSSICMKGVGYSITPIYEAGIHRNNFSNTK